MKTHEYICKPCAKYMRKRYPDEERPPSKIICPKCETTAERIIEVYGDGKKKGTLKDESPSRKD